VNETPETVRPLGLFARIVGVLTAPRATFENIVAAPRPFGVLFVMALLTGVAATVPQLMNENLLRAGVEMQTKMAERFGAPPLTAEKFEEAVVRARRWAPLGIVGAIVWLTFMTLLFTALYWVVFNAILGGTASFKQVLAINSHAHVTTALGAIAAAPIQYAQSSMTLAGPFTLGPLVSFLPDGNAVKSLLASTSVFLVWSIVVTAIGLAVLYRRKARNIAIGLIVAYLLIASTLISVFSGLTGTSR
jgi:hypothetical protein